MSTCPEQLHTRRLSVPQEDRGVFVDPPWDDFPALVANNVRLQSEYQYDFQGMPLAALRQQAQAELLADARDWTRAYRNVNFAADADGELLFLAGHQPELFHPGVWAKNFALGGLAERHGAVAVNLIVDSDTIKHVALRTPGGTPSEPHTEMIALDRPLPRVPYEERQIVDRGLLADFGPHVARQIGPFVSHPLVREYWPLVLARSQAVDKLGQCLAQARHQLEGQWGLQTLEVPQSRVCSSLSFCRFTAHLLAHLPRLRAAYNQAVGDYRAWYKIRNAAHPVPDLAEEDGWLEAPLWLWNAEKPQRRRLFARQAGRELLVSNRETIEFRLPLTPDGDAAAAAAQLHALSQRGLKIRSRALITTLWARLVLGPVFIHGIGGAKYDQVTDLLIQRFFGLQPPAMTVLSATLHLPIAGPASSARATAAAEDAQPFRAQLRQLLWQPERYLQAAHDLPGEAAALLAAKRRWILAPPTGNAARERWRAIRHINERLQPYVAAHRQRVLELQAERERRGQAESILHWRQYAFCHYPADTLQEFFAGLLPKNV